MRYNTEGRIKFPKNKFLRRARRAKKPEKPRIIEECYCPNGHSLIDDYVLFNELPGIKIKVRRNNEEEGFLVLSPVYGDHSKVTLGIKLKEGDLLDMSCPECGESLSVYSHCLACDSQTMTLFLTKEKSFSDCLVICQKVGCHNSRMVSSRRMMSSYAKTSCI